MSTNLKDILSESNKDIDNQLLMGYLSNHISHADLHDVEKKMTDDTFVNDAVEGLQQLKPAKDLQLYVDQLNNDLQKHIAKNKRRKDKRRIKDQPNTYFAIIIILLLLVICFVILRKNKQASAPVNKATTELQIK